MKYLFVAVALAALTGCGITNDGYVIPAPVGGGNSGSYTAPAPAKNLAPIQASPSPVQETHGAVSQQTCYEMEAKFQRDGRRIRLMDTRRSTSPGAILRWICVFEGEDADQGYFEEKRY